MKTIFVTTDFSAASHNAFLYSLEMAKAFGAKVVLFHAFQQLVIPNMESTIVITLEDTKNLVKDRLSQHLRAVKDQEHVPVETGYEEGPASMTILAAAAKHQADIIISGMKEKGKTFRQFFGSTVTELARHTSIPLVVVPEEASYQQPDKIALASDIAPETDVHTLDALSEIGQRFHSKIYIVRIISNRFEEVYELLNRPTKFSRLSRALETQYEYSRNKHVTEALSNFIDTEHIHMLALVPHKHTLLERWFFKSSTKSMIFKSRIPLLILPERQVKHDPAAEEEQRATVRQ